LQSASQNNATGQIPRCFAMNPNITCGPSRSRRRLVLDVTFGFELLDFAARPLDLSRFRLHDPLARKGLNGIALEPLDPLAQLVLVDIEITGRLGNRSTSFSDQLDGLDLELTRKLTTLHTPPPAPS